MKRGFYKEEQQPPESGKQPKTLSGIETSMLPSAWMIFMDAENNLKPYQGLKQSIRQYKMQIPQAENNLKPYQGLKPVFDLQ